MSVPFRLWPKLVQILSPGSQAKRSLKLYTFMCEPIDKQPGHQNTGVKPRRQWIKRIYCNIKCIAFLELLEVGLSINASMLVWSSQLNVRNASLAPGAACVPKRSMRVLSLCLSAVFSVRHFRTCTDLHRRYSMISRRYLAC